MRPWALPFQRQILGADIRRGRIFGRGAFLEVYGMFLVAVQNVMDVICARFLAISIQLDKLENTIKGDKIGENWTFFKS